MKQKMRSTKGITLIALVITIIVLLILAAVTIATLTGENGILTKASSASEAHKKAEIKERVLAEVYGSYDDNGHFQMDLLKENLKNHLEIKEIKDNDDGSINFTLNGYMVTVESNGTVFVGKEVEKEEKPTNIQAKSITVENLTVKEGKTGKLKVTTEPDNITEGLTYSSNDMSKVTVDNNGTVTGLATGTATITVEGKESKVTGTCTVTVEEDHSIVSKVSVENYGDYVDYKVDINDDKETEKDWKIFYSDGDRVFLIASDYLKSTKIISLANPEDIELYDCSGEYSISSWEVPEMQTEGMQLEMFKATKYNILSKKNNKVACHVSTLLNTNNWINFKNNYSDYVIGAPTLEMWLASWNAKGELKGESNYTKLEETASDDENGYRINGGNSVVLKEVGDQESKTGHYDELYFPPFPSDASILVSILASPGAVENCYWGTLRYAGLSNLNGDLQFGNGITLRPVVALNPDTEGTKNQEGIWELSE